MQMLTGKINRFFTSRNFNLSAFLLIAGMILIAYSNTFTASFHFDDNPAIVDNPTIKHVSMENIMSVLGGGRPVVYLSLMFNYAAGGLNVIGWHMFNIGVHIANSIFVYLLILWTLNLPLFGKHYEEKAKRMALFGALLFGVHPIQTESVTYIISRTELLATFFYLATFLLFIKGASTGRFSYALGMFCTTLLSMGSKEWAVTLPALLIVYDFLFFAQGKIKPILSRWKLYVATAIPWALVLSSVLSRLDLFAPSGSGGVGFNIVSTTGLSPWTYLLTSLNVIWTYIRLLFLPINQNLDYTYPVAKTLFEVPTILSLLGHLAVVAGAVWLYTKKRVVLIPFGLAWFYIGLSPAQSFVPVIDIIFEHRVYMPSIGFFLAFVTAYELVFEWLAEQKAKKEQLVAGSS